MTDDMILVMLILLVHLLVCIVLWVLVRIGVLRVKGYLVPFMIMTPLFGPICIIMVHIKDKDETWNSAPTLEKLRVNDEIYRRMIIEGREDVPQIVPLEEALLINEPFERRKLVLDMLNEDPTVYLPVLEKARMDEDAEVAHYAATAMAEISKEDDKKLVELARSYAAAPDDRRVIQEYADGLRDFLDRNTGRGQAVMIRRAQYIELIKKLMSNPPTVNELKRLAQAQLDAGRMAEAKETIDSLMRMSPQRGDAYLLLIQYYAIEKDGEGIRQTLQALEEAHVYIGAADRETIEFWKGNSA